MLQIKTIEQNTFFLLKEMMQTPEINHFDLAGGTTLALYLGHRVSIDLDFFTTQEFDSTKLVNLLEDKYQLSSIIASKNALSIYILYNEKNIKIDFLRHNYKIIKPSVIEDGVRLHSIEDVAAMKLSAVLNRGAKKDFYDIYELLKHYSLHELVSFFKIKYPNTNVLMLIKSLDYFLDADVEPDPIALNKAKWIDIKEEISNQIRINY
jgi:predicted nucleotidyltransferase component of viral defense system